MVVISLHGHITNGSIALESEFCGQKNKIKTFCEKLNKIAFNETKFTMTYRQLISIQ